MTKGKKFDPYAFLWHAELHCRFGSETVDRPADDGDLAAVEILKKARQETMKEKTEQVDWKE